MGENYYVKYTHMQQGWMQFLQTEIFQLYGMLFF